MSKFFVRFFRILCIVICIISIIAVVQFSRKQATYISYSQVLLYLQEDEISSITVKANNPHIRIVLTDESVKRAQIPNIESFSHIIYKKIENGSKIEFEVIQNRTPHIFLIILIIIQICLCISLYVYPIYASKNKTKHSEENEWTCAIHEAGHAIVAYVVAPQLQCLEISIIYKSEDDSEGRVKYNHEDFQNITTQKKLQILYAGKAAEKLIMNSNSTGCVTDLQRATNYVYNDVFNNGCSDNLLVKLPKKITFNNHLILYKITTMNTICKKEYENTYSLIRKYEDQIIELAQILVTQKTLTQNQLKKFLEEKI